MTTIAATAIQHPNGRADAARQIRAALTVPYTPVTEAELEAWAPGILKAAANLSRVGSAAEVRSIAGADPFFAAVADAMETVPVS